MYKSTDNWDHDDSLTYDNLTKNFQGLQTQEEDIGEEFPIAHNEDIKLKSAIEIRDLIECRGIIIDPDLDDSSANTTNNFDDEVVKKYYESSFYEKSNESDLSDADDGDDISFEVLAQKMTNLRPDGLVKKRLRVTGLETFGQVPDNASVTVHYCLYFDGNDEPFDSTRLRGRPERFNLDGGKILAGLEIGIKSMLKKEKSEFLINYMLAFGEMGCPPRVHGKADVFAKVELIDFVHEHEAESLLLMDAEARNEKYNLEKIFPIVRKQHGEGNSYVEQKEWKLAARKFERSSRLLEDVNLASSEEEAQQKKYLLKLYLNLAYCYIKLCFPNRACIVLQKALKIDSNNTKGNYRLGLAKRMLGNREDAMRFLVKAQKTEPQNIIIGKEITSLSKEMEIERHNEKTMYKRMFGTNEPVSPRNPKVKVSSDVYQECVKMLENFEKDSGCTEKYLSSALPKEVVATLKDISDDYGVTLVEIEKPHKIVKIVKKV